MAYRDEREMFEERRAQLEGELRQAREQASHQEVLAARLTRLEAEIADLNEKIGKARRALPLLDSIQIASPCSAKWEEMKGNEVTRFCGECHLHVHNLSGMTREQAEETLQASLEGRLCVRFFQRADDTVITQDCPVGLKKKRRKQRIATAAGVSMLAASGLAFAFRRADASGRADAGDLSDSVKGMHWSHHEVREVMGDVPAPKMGRMAPPQTPPVQPKK